MLSLHAPSQYERVARTGEISVNPTSFRQVAYSSMVDRCGSAVMLLAHPHMEAWRLDYGELYHLHRNQCAKMIPSMPWYGPL